MVTNFLIYCNNCLTRKLQVLPKFLVLSLLHSGNAILMFPVRLDLQSNGDPFTLFKGLVYWGKLLTFNSNPKDQSNYTAFSEFEASELGYGFGALVIVLVIRIQDALGYLLMLLTGLLLWESCVSFEKFWRQKHLTASNILAQYDELKKLSEIITECDGRKTFVFIIYLLVFLSTRIDSIFLIPDWIIWAGFMYEFIQPTAFVIFSCEVSRKVST